MEDANNSFQSRHQDFNDQLEKIQTQINHANKEVSTAQSKIEAQFSNWEASSNSQVTSKLSDLSESFSQSQIERDKIHQETQNELSSVVSEIRQQAKDALAKNQAQLADAKKNLRENNAALVEEANSVVSKLNSLYDQAGRDVLAADFAGNAAKESESFALFSKIAAGSFVLAAVVLAILWVSLSTGSDFKFSDLFMRFPVSVVFLLPGFYFSSLAAGHRKSSLSLRSLGLRIKAFDAYLINAKVEDVEGLKREMAKEFFEEKQDESVKRSIFSRGNGEQFNRLADIAEKVVDKVPNVND